MCAEHAGDAQARPRHAQGAVHISITSTLDLAIKIPNPFGRLVAPQFVVVVAAGSITGTLIGGLLLGHVSSAVLIPILALLLSAYKEVWRHYPSRFSDGFTLRWLVASRQAWDDT